MEILLQLFNILFTLLTIQAIAYLWFTNSPLPQWAKEKATKVIKAIRNKRVQNDLLYILNCPYCFTFWLSLVALIFPVGWAGIPLALINAYVYSVINY